MKIETHHTDAAVLAELGQRLARRRLDLGLTQAEAARQAGLGKRTLERLEAGGGVQLTAFLRVLRALDWLNGLEQLAPPEAPSPMALLKLKGGRRKRATSSGRAPQKSSGEWTWGETP